MGLLDFLFGETKSIEDEFFGRLLFLDSKDKTKRYFEGRRHFKPSSQDIDLVIFAEFSGPTEQQRKFFNQIEEDYSKLIEKIKPLIIDEFQNWQPDFIIKYFEKEFIPVHMSIPCLTQMETNWELAFNTIHDLNHTITITLRNFEPIEILIDG
jgi:hypothetical protein